MILVLLTVEWMQRSRQHGLELRHVRKGPVRWAIYYALIAILYVYGGEQQDFIYFQF